MARARNVKPGFFTNDELVDCDPLARLLFIGLWCEADCRGILADRPKALKLKLLPGDNCDADVLLCELESHGFIRRYESNGARCIAVVNFDKHQNPHVNEKPNDLPAPEQHHASTVPAPEQHQSNPADSLNTDSLNTDSLRENGAAAPTPTPSRPNSRSKPKTPVPKDFTLTAKHYEAGAELGLSREEIERETKKFIVHYQAHGKPMKDWQAAWNKWMLQVDDFRPARRNGNAETDIGLDAGKYKDGGHLRVRGRAA